MASVNDTSFQLRIHLHLPLWSSDGYIFRTVLKETIVLVSHLLMDGVRQGIIHNGGRVVRLRIVFSIYEYTFTAPSVDFFYCMVLHVFVLMN